ncbi:MAG: hypothetical protein JNJ61_29885 [Anaerolineae bacterium]|nr:hypothetical protein [Anaerolineae bacterium]
MGYYMRYISFDSQPIDLGTIETALKQIDAAYHVRVSDIPGLGELFHGEFSCGEIEINGSEDDIFADDITEFRELVGEATTLHEQHVLDVLNQATWMVAVETFWEGDQSEAVLSKIDPLWDWLFINRKGVLQADFEGFYDESGVIVPRNFMI